MKVSALSMEEARKAARTVAARLAFEITGKIKVRPLPPESVPAPNAQCHDVVFTPI